MLLSQSKAFWVPQLPCHRVIHMSSYLRESGIRLDTVQLDIGVDRVLGDSRTDSGSWAARS